MSEETWVCMVCGDERPDHLIGVQSFEYPLRIGAQTVSVMTVNVRHCTDRSSCVVGAAPVAQKFVRDRTTDE
jgi:hypothetical protein